MTAQATAAAQPQLITVAEGVHAWIGASGDSNAGAVETPQGVIAIDAQQYPRLAQAFRAAVTARTDKPVCMLIDTHCHLDHTAGNIVFADVPILAHDKTLAAMHANLGAKTEPYWTVSDYAAKIKMLFGQNLFELVPAHDPAHDWFRQRISGPDYETMTIAPPTRTFADHFSFHLANDTMHLDYWGPAHCDGDVIVSLTKSKVVFLGDLLFHGRFPWLGDCDLSGLIDRLARVLTLDVTVVVPGHGAPTDLAQVARFRDMLVALRTAVEAAIKAGVSEEAAVHEVKLPQYAALPRYADWLPHDVRAAYRYLRG
jgi:glyoxylase-like metal-dependent hydrolase (beta-lactamase superfamily II)